MKRFRDVPISSVLGYLFFGWASTAFLAIVVMRENAELFGLYALIVTFTLGLAWWGMSVEEASEK